MEYNSRKKSLSFWGESSSNNTDRQLAGGSTMPGFLETLQRTLCSPGRAKDAPRLDCVRLATCRLCMSEARRLSGHSMDLQKALIKSYRHPHILCPMTSRQVLRSYGYRFTHNIRRIPKPPSPQSIADTLTFSIHVSGILCSDSYCDEWVTKDSPLDA